MPHVMVKLLDRIRLNLASHAPQAAGAPADQQSCQESESAASPVSEGAPGEGKKEVLHLERQRPHVKAAFDQAGLTAVNEGSAARKPGAPASSKKSGRKRRRAGARSKEKDEL